MKNLIFLFIFTFFFLSHSMAQQCHEIFKKTPARNTAIAGLLEEGINIKSVTAVLLHIFKLDGDRIPSDKFGFLPAAQVSKKDPGKYGVHEWLRDKARSVYGVRAKIKLLEFLLDRKLIDPGYTSKLEAARTQYRQMSLAMLNVISDPIWTENAIRNIIDKDLHRGDPGQREVIPVRFFLPPRQENRPLTAKEMAAQSEWGHKQNDALSAFAENILLAIEAKVLRPEDFSFAAKENIILLASYLMRLQYWHMWDSGAWEEGLQKRTSSIGQSAQFLEIFASHFYSPSTEGPLAAFFKNLREETLPQTLNSMPPERLFVKDLITESLAEHNLAQAVSDGAKHVNYNANQTVPVETVNNEGNPLRAPDMATAHISWSSSKLFSLDTLLNIAKGVKSLEQPYGYNRYKDDWFLYGQVEALRNMERLGLVNQIAIPDGNGGYKIATKSEAEKIVALHDQQKYTKDMSEIKRLAGGGFDAQWTLGDAHLTQIYAKAYLETGDREHLQLALRHYERLTRLVTGGGLIASNGKPIEAGRLPEAYLPYRFFKNGKIEIGYLVSPNSPLNWSTAEFLIASEQILLALEKSENALSR